MWDTVQNNQSHLSHDRPCSGCGHGTHTYLPCSDVCRCEVGRLGHANPVGTVRLASA